MTEGNRPGRNEPCSCGSGKKYKQCCLAKDEAADRAKRVEAEKAAPVEAPAEGEAEAAPGKARRGPRARSPGSAPRAGPTPRAASRASAPRARWAAARLG